MGQLRITVLFGLILVVQRIYAAPAAEEEESYRLSVDTVPVSYDIVLTTEIHNGVKDFTGFVKIEINVKKKTKVIEINFRKIDILDVSLFDKSGTLLKSEFKPDQVSEKLIITSEKDLALGKGSRLEINYKGKLRTDNAGFYESYYFDDESNKRWLATTQFETTDARHAFPCYDEPARIAKFRITIIHGKSYEAISNMPVVEKKPQKGDMVETTFQETPDMSTYLVAFVVSDFDFIQNHQNKFSHAVYSQPGTLKSALMAIQTGRKVLNGFENYLGVSYTLPDMKQIAVPDFAAGAMENWGLVTYREEVLLFTEGVSSTNTKTKISNTISHELAHQWFGNLVSPEWWEYTWLNEGFATLFAYIGTNMTHPEWKIFDLFLVSEYQNALSVDQTKNTRPMTHYEEKPLLIAGLFDTISYSKAGSVLRMIQHAIGAENFKKGLTTYLNANSKVKSATEDKLFDSLAKSVPATSLIKNFKEFGKSWSQNAGFPVVNVTRDYATRMVTMKQSRFVIGSVDPANQIWQIPINWITASSSDEAINNTLPQYILTKASEKVDVGQTVNSEWFLINKQQTGYYRVAYDQKNWNLITAQLHKNYNKIHTYQRAQLIDDSFAFALAKKLDFKTALDISSYIQHEREYVPWAAASNVFEKLNNMLDGTSDYEYFQSFIDKMTSSFYKEVSFAPKPDEPHLRKFTRKIIVDWACRANLTNCLVESNKLLQDTMKTGKKVDPDSREVVYCNGLRTADEAEYKFVMEKLTSSRDAAERRELMSVLGCVLDPKLLKSYLDTSISNNNGYRRQEFGNVLPAVYGRSNPGLNATILWLKEYWKAYAAVATDFTKTNPLSSAIRGIASRIFNKPQSDLFKQMVDVIDDPTLTEVIKTAQANIDANINWVNEHKKDVAKWFKDYAKGEDKEGSAAFIWPSVTLIFTLSISLLVQN